MNSSENLPFCHPPHVWQQLGYRRASRQPAAGTAPARHRGAKRSDHMEGEN